MVHSSAAVPAASMPSGSALPAPSTAPPPLRPRVDTHALKAQLATALGTQGARYWAAMLDFFAGRIAREEFERVAKATLRSDQVHLHNSLLLGIIYNASPDVHLPSNAKRGLGARGGLSSAMSGSDSEDAAGPSAPRKRLRALIAGMPQKERARLKAAAKPPPRAAVMGALGWAGAGADMLEKKRKEEERRRAKEEKRRVRLATTEIGSADWRAEAATADMRLRDGKDKLSASTQQAVARAMSAPLCAEAKELPDVDRLLDTMTLAAVENELPGGVAPQAAALLLAALQNHLQNVASSMIAAVRSHGADGIRTSGPAPPASASAAVAAAAAAAYAQAQARLSRSPSVMEEDDEAHTQHAGPSSSEYAARTNLLAAPGAQSPGRSLRNMRSDLSTRTGNSTLATCSAADSSMISFVSTAPTSHAHGSDDGHDTSGDADADGDTSMQDATAMLSPRSAAAKAGAAAAAKHASAQGAAALRLRDVDFVFALSPHAAVEPLGQSSAARLLLPADEQQDDAYVGRPSVSDERLEPLAGRNDSTIMQSAAHRAALAKVADAGGESSMGARARYIIDQSVVFGLFDRPALVEQHAAEASGRKSRPTKGGLSLASSSAPASGPNGLQANGSQAQDPPRDMTDEMEARRRAHLSEPQYDVADPVALLAGFAD